VSTASAHPPFRDLGQQAEAARLGMWVFLATEVLFFGPLFLGYLYVRLHFPAEFAAASRHTDLVSGTLNTAILLTSSLTMALAAAARREGDAGLARRLLLATAALGAAFLALKGFEYYGEWQEGRIPWLDLPGGGMNEASDLFYFLYFAMTGLHALHLVVGMAIVLTLATLLARGRVQAANAERVEIAGLYWHFVDMVWIFLYPLLYLVGRAG
jgi:cytochrome c oxidase subunit 3